MNVRFVSTVAVFALATVCGVGRGGTAQQGRAGVEEGVQVLTRGPVHEAFAGTVSFNPEPGMLAPKAPPPRHRGIAA